MSADRNLLFGILALQLNFVSRDQLVEGMHAWVLEKSKSLGQIFVASKAMDVDQHKLLEALVDKHVEKHGGDVQKSIQQLSSLDPNATQQLRAIEDSDLQKSIVQIPLDPFATAPISKAAERFSSRFRIIRPYARGGLGEVFLAQDTELSREVALKEIQSPYADNSDSRKRFLREAEITGRLEHPGIVPVYGLGTYDDGRPFYAMKFVKGQSLQNAIDSFHNDSETKAAKSFMAGDVGIKFRELLGRFIDICNAVHYAHSRGILHRDLKPGNVMIGEFGETLVVDWGLAKVLGEQVIDGSDKSVLEPSPNTNSAPTIQGIAVGTPAYMSPEQAAGQLDLLGPATDVYSLGATLYYLLTKAPPVSSSSAQKTMNMVKAGNIVSPRIRIAFLSAAIDAICMKALSRDPSMRYRTANDLALDVERFLADEPCTAYRESTTQNLQRFLRKHRTLTVSAAALGLMFAVGMGMYARITLKNNRGLAKLNAQLDSQNLKLTIANQSAERARDNAETQTRLAVASSERAEAAYNASEWRHFATQIASAQHNWEIGDVESAWKLLDSTRVDRRGWEYDYLQTTFLQNQTTLEGHTRNVTDVCFSPDGKWIVSASVDKTLKIWNATSGQALFTLKGHTDLVKSASFSLDSSKIISVGRDNNLRVWDVKNGEEIVSLRLQTGEVSTALFSPNATRIITVGSDKTLRIWDATSGRQAFSIAVDTSYPTNPAFSPDGRSIVAASDVHTLKVWDAVNGNEIHILSQPGLPVGHPVYSPDGTRIVASDHNGTLLWNAVSGERIDFLNDPNDQRGVMLYGSLSPDGKRIVTHDPGISESKIWDAQGGKLIHKIERTGSPFFSPDSRRIVCTDRGQGSTVTKVWTDMYDTESGEKVFSRDGIYRVQFSEDGKTFVAVESDSRFSISDATSFSIWDATNFTLTGIFKGLRGGSTVLINPRSGRVLSWRSKDKTIKFWDTAKRQETLTLTGHRHSVNNLSFSPDGSLFASASWEVPQSPNEANAYLGAIQIWDTYKGRKLARLDGHSKQVNSISFSNDGKWLVSASDDNTVKIWEAANYLAEIDSFDSRLRNASATLVGHTMGVNSASFSPDGKQIVSASADKTMRIWDVASGEETHSLVGHKESVNNASYSPDGKWIVSASADKTLKIWDADTGQEKTFVKTGISNQFINAADATENPPQSGNLLMRHLDHVNSAVFSPDGKKIVSASDDQTLKLWDANTGEEVLSLKGHSANVRCASFSLDGKRIVSASADKTLKVWEPGTGQETITLKHPFQVRGAWFSPDSKRILSASSDYSLRVWNASISDVTATLKGHSESVSSASFSPNGKWIVSASLDRSLKLWDAVSGHELLTLKHEGPASNASFSLDGKRIVSASLDRSIKVWDVASGQETLNLKGHTDRVASTSFSPDGQRIVSASADMSIKVWDATNGQETLNLKGHTDRVTSASFSPDGQRIVSASADMSIKVWDATNGQETLNLKGHTDRVTSASFSPDGKRIVSASADMSVKVWDASNGQELLNLKGHTDRVTSASFSPDGKRIVSASADMSIKVWDATNGREILSLAGHTNEVLSSSFSPDGQLIVSASADNSLKVWEVPCEM